MPPFKKSDKVVRVEIKGGNGKVYKAVLKGNSYYVNGLGYYEKSKLIILEDDKQ